MSRGCPPIRVGLVPVHVFSFPLAQVLEPYAASECNTSAPQVGHSDLYRAVPCVGLTAIKLASSSSVHALRDNGIKRQITADVDQVLCLPRPLDSLIFSLSVWHCNLHVG